MNELRKKSATVIQKNYRGMLGRELYKLLQKQKIRLGNRFLVKKKCLILKPFKAVGNITIEEEERDYYLNVYANPPTKTLSFHLFDCTDGLKYDAEASYSHIKLKKKKINDTYNIRILDEFSDTVIQRFYIVDHLLLLRDNSDKNIDFRQTHSSGNFTLKKYFKYY